MNKQWNLKLIATIILIFLLGAVAGILVSAGFYKFQMDSVLSRDSSMIHTALYNYLYEQLNLRPGQDKKIEVILRGIENTIYAFRKENQEKVFRLIHEAYEKILPELNGKQTILFKKLYENFRKEWYIDD